MGLNRERKVNLMRDVALIKAVSGDTDGAFDHLKDYINNLFPCFIKEKTNRSKEMFDYFNEKKEQQMSVAVDDNTDVIKLKIG